MLLSLLIIIVLSSGLTTLASSPAETSMEACHSAFSGTVDRGEGMIDDHRDLERLQCMTSPENCDIITALRANIEELSRDNVATKRKLAAEKKARDAEQKVETLRTILKKFLNDDQILFM
ncbi:uncharacterized protein LOC135171425 [Diachasmimorpha longicaudata]|uniref:uncharacterized protein LOC135171425 n=1 Tax=Diachasmimorpha longicaudata TaxID=58733 RepID=UPI0030B8ED6C